MDDKTTKKPKTNAPKKVKDKDLNDAEQKAYDRLCRKVKERIRPPKFKLNEKGKVEPDEEKVLDACSKLLETTGSIDEHFSTVLIDLTSQTLNSANIELKFNFCAALMHGLKPRDEMEGVLIAQMVGTHNMSMEYLRRSITPNVMPEVVHGYANMACKLLNLWLKQLEALQKYRGKGSKQKVIVEHVHVNKGGQAVVGNIENIPRGEGDE